MRGSRHVTSGLRAVIAKSFARIHWQNLANYGVLALEFENPGDHDTIDRRSYRDIHTGLPPDRKMADTNKPFNEYLR